MRHHSPDLSVIFGVKERKDWITFDVKTEGVRPRLIIEVTSPATRSNDLVKKVQQYAKVRRTVLCDRRCGGEQTIAGSYL